PRCGPNDQKYHQETKAARVLSYQREVLENWHAFVMDGGRIAFLEPELLIVDGTNYPRELGRTLAVTDGPGSVETLRAALAAMRRPAHLVVTGKERA
ncbi:MAG: hypothetical protein AAFX52_12305, partial [Pseudomonadota bacterium]